MKRRKGRQAQAESLALQALGSRKAAETRGPSGPTGESMFKAVLPGRWKVGLF